MINATILLNALVIKLCTPQCCHNIYFLTYVMISKTIYYERILQTKIYINT